MGELEPDPDRSASRTAEQSTPETSSGPWGHVPTSRSVPLERSSLIDLAEAEAQPELAQRLLTLWDDGHDASVRLAGRYLQLAPFWHDCSSEEFDEDVAEAETLAVGLALRCTRGVAHHRIQAAHLAVHSLPLTLERLKSGEFPAAWFERLVSKTRHLGDADLASVDETASRWSLTVTAEQFHRKLSYLLARLESQRETPAHLTPEGRRRVEVLPPGSDGIGCLQVIGPIPEIIALARELDTSARAVQAAQRHQLEAGDVPSFDPDGIAALEKKPLSLARIRYELLTGARFDTGDVKVPTERFRLNVTIPAMTLLGASQEPGMLDGVIPIPAPLARELAGRCDTWYRVLTDPGSSAFLPLPADRYKPTQAMLEHLRLRHSTCAVPGCTRPASWACEHDHIEEYCHDCPEDGGPTAVENGHLLCWQHHRAKTLGLLDPIRLADGPDGLGRTSWEIKAHARVVIADDTDLATPRMVEDLQAAWELHLRLQEERRAEEKRPREGPPPAPPPPF